MDLTPALVPLLHVTDVARAIAFYERLGFTVKSREGDSDPYWVNVCASGNTPAAELMLARVSSPPQPRGAVLYFYVKDVGSLHEELARAGIRVSALTTPAYATAGEFEVHDPDGHTLLVGQPDC